MRIHVTILGGDCPRTFTLNGRIGQTMHHLHRAGTEGITALHNPALRLAAYIKSLRIMGFIIDTEREKHEGDYPGVHARYRLVSAVTVRTDRHEGAE